MLNFEEFIFEHLNFLQIEMLTVVGGNAAFDFEYEEDIWGILEAII